MIFLDLQDDRRVAGRLLRDAVMTMGWRIATLLGAVAALGPCDVAVVGGGWAGVYSAYRLAPTFEGTVCLFEAREKTGGRTYSVHEEDGLTIDIGAYRFGYCVLWAGLVGEFSHGIQH